MKRRDREISMLSMSALDVLAMATGVFVLLLVMLMPYYRKSFDAHAEIEAARVASTETRAKIPSLEDTARLHRGEAEAAQMEAARIDAAAAALERRASVVRKPTAARPVQAPVVPDAKANTPVVEALDLVFAIDTTASMGPVIRELVSSMQSIVRILKRLVPSLRVGVAAYSDRDTGLPALAVLPLTPTDPHLPRILAFLEGLHESPVGSKTIEEDMYLGLQAAMAMPLRPNALQTIVVIGDAAAHPEEQEATLFRAQDFAKRSPKRTVSALFVTTPSALRDGLRSRPFFIALAKAGGGTFNDHTGSMIESVLLSVLVE